jgi:hypothetical protein
VLFLNKIDNRLLIIYFVLSDYFDGEKFFDSLKEVDDGSEEDDHFLIFHAGDSD